MDKDIDILKDGGVGVIATDTIYGIVGQALNRDTVQRIYHIKKRTPTKPFIILISDIKDLLLFNIFANPKTSRLLNKYWPGPVSIILKCGGSSFEYLHRGTNTLAFRLPDKPELVNLIKTTGPLVAPSANPEGLLPAQTIDQAKAYFGDTIDFYSKGIVSQKASKIIKITDSGVEIIRP